MPECHFSLAKSDQKRPLMFRDFLGHETSRGGSFCPSTKQRKNSYFIPTNQPKQPAFQAGYRQSLAVNKPSLSLNMSCDIYTRTAIRRWRNPQNLILYYLNLCSLRHLDFNKCTLRYNNGKLSVFALCTDKAVLCRNNAAYIVKSAQLWLKNN